MKTLTFLITFFIVLGTTTAIAQVTPDSTKAELFLITKNDGTEYIGKVLSDDGREILIETETLGKIYIPKSEVKSIKKIEDKALIVNGELHEAGPFSTRYCFTTNALPIVKGDDYTMVNLYGPEVHFALSDNFSLGIMSTWIASPMVLAAKYSFETKNENINFSVGTLLGTSGYLNSFSGFGGLHFANVTFGSRAKNLTFSGGYAYMQTGGKQYIYEEGVFYYSGYSTYYGYEIGVLGPTPLVRGPIFSVAGIVKVGAKASFVFDSMIGVFTQPKTNIEVTELTPPDYNVTPSTPGTYKAVVTKYNYLATALFLMPGMRFQTTDKKAFQFSLAGVTVFRENRNLSFPIPMCTWFRKF